MLLKQKHKKELETLCINPCLKCSMFKETDFIHYELNKQWTWEYVWVYTLNVHLIHDGVWQLQLIGTNSMFLRYSRYLKPALSVVWKT